tara:strand:+ start:124 stop:741 length:618 start_codon:yes stop_codon:yes gene_type:complete
MNTTEIIASAFIGYFCGCIQTAYFIGYYKMKSDIRNSGSGNAGASNIITTLGWKWGIFTGVVDMLKGAIAVLIINYLFENSSNHFELQFFAGTMAVIGHIFPFFMKFKGGKGISTFIGMLIAINPIIGLISGSIVSFFLLTTGFVAPGSVLIYILLPLYIYYDNFSSTVIIMTSILALIGIAKHRINFVRMRNKSEKTLWDVLKK